MRSQSDLRGAGGRSSNRHGDCSPRDFLTSYGFRRLAGCSSARRRVCGLDYTFTLARSRLRRCPSSLYTFPCAFAPGLGSGLPVTGSPEFGQFCAAGFPAGTQSVQVPCVYQFRHARMWPNLSIRALCANGKARACESARRKARPAPALFRGRGWRFDRRRLINARRALAAEPQAQAPALLPGEG